MSLLPPRPSRKATLALLAVAGYHDDRQAWTRLYVEGRVSIGKAQAQWDRGQQQRRAGVPCSCAECANARSRKKEEGHG